ncbi:MAG: hypothetical protein JO072_13795 [Parafilimonas sp.]|nr:hypothetical protein [Parafilimonas sp.]
MRESNHTDEFEDYLRHQVDEHRIYPSDRVWKNIRGNIHTPKKWPALSVFTVLIISALVIGTVISKPVPDSLTPNFVYSLQTPANDKSSKPDEIKSAEQVADNNYSIDQLTNQTITAATEKIKIEEAVAMQLSHSDIASSQVASLINTNYPSTTIIVDAASIKSAEKTNSSFIASTDNSSGTLRSIDSYLFNVTSRLRSILNTEPVHYSNGGVAFFTPRNNDLDYDNFNLQVPYERKKDLLPSLDQLGKNSSRFDFRFYITPSISYRRLDEKKTSGDTKNSGAALESDYRVDPSKAINQSPAFGYETGFGIGYKLNNRFSLTGGFQFNISQYKINAFLYKDEPIAVTLNEGEYASTVNTVSNIRSIPGNDPLTIKNRYYQISMPLGIEWKILGNGRFSWGLGTSIQPTYTFDKQPLIISSNYKNYADGSAYVRNLNVNASAETFLGYTTGSYRWQIGPQFRYQMLPSLVDKYPNKEYLFNYGLKLGVVKQLK